MTDQLYDVEMYSQDNASLPEWLSDFIRENPFNSNGQLFVGRIVQDRKNQTNDKMAIPSVCILDNAIH